MQLAYRTHVRAVVQRTRLAFARVPDRPQAVSIRGPYSHLDRVLDAMTMPHLLHKADHPSDGSCRIILQAERERQIEEQLGIRRSLDGGVQRPVYGEREVTLEAGEVTHEAIVD